MLQVVQSSQALQSRHLVPALVDLTSARAWLYKHPWITFGKEKKPSTSLTHVVCESKLRSFMRSATCSRIHAQETAWQSGVRSFIMYELSAHSVHELNAGILPHILRPDLSGHWLFAVFRKIQERACERGADDLYFGPLSVLHRTVWSTFRDCEPSVISPRDDSSC